MWCKSFVTLSANCRFLVVMQSCAFCGLMPCPFTYPKMFWAGKENVRFLDSLDFENLPDFPTRRDVR